MINIETTHVRRVFDWRTLKFLTRNREVADGVIRTGDRIGIMLKDKSSMTLDATYDEKGRLFFIFHDTLEELMPMNSDDDAPSVWMESELRRRANGELFRLLPDELQEVIEPTTIKQIVDGQEYKCIDRLFCPSKTQIFGRGSWTEYEPDDAPMEIFTSGRERAKRNGSAELGYWWLRTPYFHDPHYRGFWTVTSSGDSCFCRQLSPVIGVALAFSIQPEREDGR